MDDLEGKKKRKDKNLSDNEVIVMYFTANDQGDSESARRVTIYLAVTLSYPRKTRSYAFV